MRNNQMIRSFHFDRVMSDDGSRILRRASRATTGKRIFGYGETRTDAVRDLKAKEMIYSFLADDREFLNELCGA